MFAIFLFWKVVVKFNYLFVRIGTIRHMTSVLTDIRWIVIFVEADLASVRESTHSHVFQDAKHTCVQSCLPYYL